MRKRLDAAQSWARTNIGKYIRQKEWRYNAEKKVFQTGVNVWLFTPPRGNCQITGQDLGLWKRS
jgi:hypothetical protein